MRFLADMGISPRTVRGGKEVWIVDEAGADAVYGDEGPMERSAPDLAFPVTRPDLALPDSA